MQQNLVMYLEHIKGGGEEAFIFLIQLVISSTFTSTLTDSLHFLTIKIVY